MSDLHEELDAALRMITPHEAPVEAALRRGRWLRRRRRVAAVAGVVSVAVFATVGYPALTRPSAAPRPAPVQHQRIVVTDEPPGMSPSGFFMPTARTPINDYDSQSGAADPDHPIWTPSYFDFTVREIRTPDMDACFTLFHPGIDGEGGIAVGGHFVSRMEGGSTHKSGRGGGGGEDDIACSGSDAGEGHGYLSVEQSTPGT